MKYYLAVDIGASSGRHIIGYKNEEGVLETEEMYRFKNGNTLVDGHLTWDVKHLFSEIKNGIKKCLEKYKDIESMSIDTWGVDYCLLNGDEEIFPVYAYRDSRTKESIPEVHKIMSFEELYKISGTGYNEFNTVYQLYHDKMTGRLDKATDYLMIPEYLMYKLTGVKAHEYTNASTMGLVDLNKDEYSKEIIEKLGLKKELFKEYKKPGFVLGDFKKEVQEEVGGNIKVVFCATHDTGSAVEGIEMEEPSPYISSGTWSLLGLRSPVAITTKEALDANYSNEAGPDYIRFQKNIMGLWITQCLAKELDIDFITMAMKARESEFDELFNVNDDCFLAPVNMKEEIINWFKRNNKEVPKSDSDVIKSTYRSLALSYKEALEALEKITGKEYKYLYVVGGGAKNKFLSEQTTAFVKQKAIFLPIEATSIGNLLSQMKGNK